MISVATCLGSSSIGVGRVAKVVACVHFHMKMANVWIVLREDGKENPKNSIVSFKLNSQGWRVLATTFGWPHWV